MQKRKTRDDGKTPEQRSAAAKKAAATRKANLEKGRGDITKISIDVPKKILDEFEDKVVQKWAYSSTSAAIREAMRQLMQKSSQG